MIPVGVRLTPTSVASERDTKINNYKKKSAMIKIEKGLGFQAPFLNKSYLFKSTKILDYLRGGRTKVTLLHVCFMSLKRDSKFLKEYAVYNMLIISMKFEVCHTCPQIRMVC